MTCGRGTIDISDRHPRLPTALPIIWGVYGRRLIKALALWSTDYETQCLLTSWLALDRWSPWLRDGPAIILGDFNQFAVWDRERPLNIGDIRDRLYDCGFTSCYHIFCGEEFGMESAKTYFGPRCRAHTDYIFVSSHFQVLSCDIIDSPSDHAAVVTKIRGLI